MTGIYEIWEIKYQNNSISHFIWISLSCVYVCVCVSVQFLWHCRSCLRGEASKWTQTKFSLVILIKCVICNLQHQIYASFPYKSALIKFMERIHAKSKWDPNISSLIISTLKIVFKYYKRQKLIWLLYHKWPWATLQCFIKPYGGVVLR